MDGYIELSTEKLATNDGISELNRMNSALFNNSYWDDLRVPVTSTKLGGSKDPTFAVFKTNGSGSQGVFLYWFSPTQVNELYFACQLPHNYIAGSYLRPHVHWVPKTNGSAGQVVSWGLEYSWSNLGDVFPSSTIIYGNTSMPSETLVAGKHYVTGLGQINGDSKSFSSMLVCRLFRDATGVGGTDDYADDAGVLEFDFHYNLNGSGTNEEFINV